ncbi:MAG: fibronectin type III domain-containing protein [Candidatus Lokiarchaeota archaeon]|nr:fibronectin type III domain-containing protein [Candidatus Lokiarchaeota archaeon]
MDDPSGTIISPPSMPSGLTAIYISSSQIDLNWNENIESNLMNYRVYRSKNLTGMYYIIGEPTSSDLFDYRLRVDTTYYYRISVVDIESNEGPLTGYMRATTQPRKGPPRGECPWWRRRARRDCWLFDLK